MGSGQEAEGTKWSPVEQTTLWAPGTAQTMSFCLVQKRVVKEKNQNSKSICRGNVNTACWVAVHLVGKMHLSLGGIAGSVSFSAAVSEQAGHLGPKAARGPLPGVCGWQSSPCNWLPAIIASPHLSVHLSFCQLPRAILETVHFYERPLGKAERQRFRVSRYIDLRPPSLIFLTCKIGTVMLLPAGYSQLFTETACYSLINCVQS